MYRVYAELTHTTYDHVELDSGRLFNSKAEAEAWAESYEGIDFAQYAMILIDITDYLNGYLLEGLKVSEAVTA